MSPREGRKTLRLLAASRAGGRPGRVASPFRLPPQLTLLAAPFPSKNPRTLPAAGRSPGDLESDLVFQAFVPKARDPTGSGRVAPLLGVAQDTSQRASWSKSRQENWPVAGPVLFRSR